MTFNSREKEQMTVFLINTGYEWADVGEMREMLVEYMQTGKISSLSVYGKENPEQMFAEVVELLYEPDALEFAKDLKAVFPDMKEKRLLELAQHGLKKHASKSAPVNQEAD